MHWNRRGQWIRGAVGILLLSSLTGCNRDETRVYHVPKDNSSPTQPDATPAPATVSESAAPEVGSPASAASDTPQLAYQLPDGWREKPLTEMRAASFTVLGPDGQSADVSAIPLPIVGRDMELINMWRSQVQLPATTDPDAAKKAEPISIGTEQGRLFEFASEQPMMGKSRQRILVAMLTRDSMSWFFKMAGDDSFVTSQKEKFRQFLKSVSFTETAPSQIPAGLATQNENTGSIWTIPPGWQPMPPSQFLLAEFSIPDSNGAKAEVNVAEMEGDGGGLLANVNRWRGQLGLDPISEKDMPPLVQSLDVPGGQATLVDLTGADAKSGAPTRLLGVIVAQSGQTWFYKLMGSAPLVSQQRDAFTKFIQSANYANAR